MEDILRRTVGCTALGIAVAMTASYYDVQSFDTTKQQFSSSWHS
jgi:hypothetical protein